MGMPNDKSVRRRDLIFACEGHQPDWNSDGRPERAKEEKWTKAG
jgi:hypothetical protein